MTRIDRLPTDDWKASVSSWGLGEIADIEIVVNSSSSGLCTVGLLRVDKKVK